MILLTVCVSFSCCECAFPEVGCILLLGNVHSKLAVGVGWNGLAEFNSATCGSGGVSPKPGGWLGGQGKGSAHVMPLTPLVLVLGLLV